MQRQGEIRTNTNPNPRGGAGEKPSCFRAPAPAPAPEKSLSPRPRRRFCSRHRGGQRRGAPKIWHWQCTPAGRVCLAVCAPTRPPCVRGTIWHKQRMPTRSAARSGTVRLRRGCPRSRAQPVRAARAASGRAPSPEPGRLGVEEAKDRILAAPHGAPPPKPRTVYTSGRRPRAAKGRHAMLPMFPISLSVIIIKSFGARSGRALHDSRNCRA
jgi:hypothetical protein